MSTDSTSTMAPLSSALTMAAPGDSLVASHGTRHGPPAVTRALLAPRPALRPARTPFGGPAKRHRRPYNYSYVRPHEALGGLTPSNATTAFVDI